MRAGTYYLAVALGLLACGVQPATAQQLSASAPFIINAAQLDRYNITLFGAKLGLPLQGMTAAESQVLVSNAMRLHKSVQIVEGHRVIAQCRLSGGFIVTQHHMNKIETVEYGVMVSFDSAEEAYRVSGVLRPSVDDLLRKYKPRLDEQRFWRATTPNTSLEPTATAVSVLTVR